MPSKSESQHRLMEIAAHTPGGYGGVPQSVGKEFVKADAKDDADTARSYDANDYMTVRDNPIIRAGVFQYKGSSLPGGDPDRIYNVYRPIEELEKPETLQSFIGLPIVDEHEMLGGKYERSPEDRGVHGSILESVRIQGNDVLANLRIWSRTMKNLIDQGKNNLSLGYKTAWEKSSGVFEGIRYDYIQRNIRGNHLALVNSGRNGTAVLDQSDVFDHFDLALDKMETDMADEDKKDDKKDDKTAAKNDAPGGEKKEEKAEIGVNDIHAWAKANMPKIKEFMELMSTEKDGDDEVALDGDTKEKEGDQKAMDADKDEKKDKAEDEKKEAMDSADVRRIVDTRLKASRKSIFADAAAREALAKELTPLVGTFDYAAMDSDDVAAYGAEKLGLNAPKGQERAVLSGYLAGVKKTAVSQVGFAMDSAITKPKSDGLLAKRLGAA